MSVNPTEELRQLHDGLKNIRRLANRVATETMSRELLAARIDQITANVGTASGALSALQAEFSNPEINAMIADKVKPAPANSINVLGQMNTLWLALRAAYTGEFNGTFVTWGGDVNGAAHTPITASVPNTVAAAAALRDGLNTVLSTKDRI